MSEPAFPTDNVSSYTPEGKKRPFSPGMSLRDYFAGQALAGMMAMPSDPCSGNFHNNCGEPFIGAAEYAYRMADAMLKARGQP